MAKSVDYAKAVQRDYKRLHAANVNRLVAFDAGLWMWYAFDDAARLQTLCGAAVVTPCGIPVVQVAKLSFSDYARRLAYNGVSSAVARIDGSGVYEVAEYV